MSDLYVWCQCLAGVREGAGGKLVAALGPVGPIDFFAVPDVLPKRIGDR